MLSSQINFYVLPEELSGIQQWLEERDIMCVKTYSFDLNPIIVKLNAEFSNYGQVFLTLPKWVELFEYKSYLSPSGKLTYYADCDKELIIQFDFAKITKDQLLPPSRFYFTKLYFDRPTQEFIKKDEEYVKWAMKIYRDFKKHLLVKYDFGPDNFGISYTTPTVIEHFERGEFKLRGH
ncbi:hypothetical protein [Bacteroides sp.]|uniref:hypothetical protein n=1 Tax=Bacteroides sp. TaxID=29523 RepID=UPI0025B9E120|nr:hypothetical protein [Bacteroides sp.]